jgi:hypothetical protein
MTKAARLCYAGSARLSGAPPMSETDKFLLLARRLRDRAEEALSIAETFHDPEARRTMLEIAERYVRLAVRLEAESDDAPG